MNLNYILLCVSGEKVHIRKSHKLQIHESKKDCVRKTQIRKVPNFRKVRKSKLLYIKSTNLRICDLRNLFADRPYLQNALHMQYTVSLCEAFWRLRFHFEKYSF
jgi:hypothetical protein